MLEQAASSPSGSAPVPERARVPPAVRALFAGCPREEAGGDRPFLLASGDVLLVLAGQVELFSVRVAERGARGPRTHLLQVVEGQVIVGVAPADGLGLLAVGTPGTVLARARTEALAPVALPAPPAVAQLAEGWVDVVYAAMTRDTLPALSVELSPGRETEVAEGDSARSGAEVLWVRHLEGYSRLMARPGLELSADAPTPLSRRAWLQAGAPARLLGLETPALASARSLWSGIERLHELLLRHVALEQADEERALSERVAQQAAYREATLRDACEHLADTMAWKPRAGVDAGHASGPSADPASAPLLAACRIVGSALDLAIQPYPTAPGRPAPRNPLAAILRASRVRSRRVALRGAWWLDDNGPLLAYVAEDKRPVALVRVGAAGPYVMQDPLLRTSRAVDAAAAESLEPFAVTFYRPFPERVLRMRDLVHFGLHRSAGDIAKVIGLALAGALLGMVPSMATGALFNTVIPGAQRSQLLQMTVVLLACAVTAALFSLANGVALLRIEARASASLQAAVWDRLLSLPLPFFRKYTAGDLAVRAMSVEAIRQVISGSTLQALIGMVMAGGNFALMYWYSAQMALWATLVIAIVLSLTVSLSYWQLRPQRESVRLQSRLSGLVLQLLGSIAKLRVASAEVHAFAQWVRLFSEQRRVMFRSRVVSNWLAAFNGAVPLASSLLLFYLALPLITDGAAMRTGDFLAFMAAYGACSGAIVASSLALLATVNTLPLYEQARPILETLPEADEAKTDPGVLTGDIEVRHAMFRYQADGPLVLRDLSFRIRPGEFVAFVGPSGSGKSTLFRLLLGFERMEAGSVYFDGQELGGIDVHAVRRQMGVVLQSGRLLQGEIFVNIAGSTAASLDEAWEAARMAGLEEDIRAMPMGMHTVVSDGGGTLSGGQRQRLLIARAVVNRPRILLFDEATSALDNRTQSIVSASLERLQATRVVIAHRLSTIVNADRIFVVDKGRIVQSGRYAELVAQPGPFAELAKRQIA